MQKLGERNTYTPTDIPHVRGNCDPVLNVPERVSVAEGNVVTSTYGYITKNNRISLGLAKSHINDAFVIAGGTVQERTSTSYSIQQVRKCNRKLFKGDRSHIKNTAERIVKGFQRFDKVLWRGIECFVFGRRKTGYFDLRKLEGTKVHASAKAKELVLLENAGTLLIELTKLKEVNGKCGANSFHPPRMGSPLPLHPIR